MKADLTDKVQSDTHHLTTNYKISFSLCFCYFQNRSIKLFLQIMPDISLSNRLVYFSG